MSRAVIRDSLSISIAVGTYGAAFGVASVAAGLSLLQTCALSLLLFSGASQFAVAGVLGAGGSAVSAIMASALLALRNGFYGARMAPLLQVRGVKRLLASQITIDESTAIALAHEQSSKDDARKGFWLTGGGIYLFWNLATLLGALGANALGDPAQWGLDATIPAAFLGLLWPRLTNTRARLVAVGSVALALILTPLLSPGLPIIACVLIPIIAGWRVRS
ncbi:MAG: branched-chain amino acid ABC transporter permease [Actinobacteria bacterium]|nr:branched-chain amino acid ABC transporter permease [Actinomycetota bacterium]